MNIKKVNRILLCSIIVIIIVCVGFNIWVFTHLKAPVINTLVSARIVGADERNIFVEMTVDIDNTSRIPYHITGATLAFFDFEQQIARVYLGEDIFITGMSNTIIKLNASIRKDTFQRLMTNAIEQYSFHLVGNMRTSVLFFPKTLRINKNIPVNVEQLLAKFITDAFRNAVSVYNIRFSQGLDGSFMVCNLLFLNRAGLDITINDLTATAEINRVYTGVIDIFEPFQFMPYERQRAAGVRFIFPQANLLTDVAEYRYRITGRLQAELWEKIYTFPIELLGEY